MTAEHRREVQGGKLSAECSGNHGHGRHCVMQRQDSLDAFAKVRWSRFSGQGVKLLPT